MQLFVSYARPDRLRAESLAVQLRQAGIEVWLDSDLVGGQRWWDRILGQLRSCDAVVAALSKASIRSQACRSEREYAIQLGKPVLPITPSPVTGVSPHRGMAITTAILSFITILLIPIGIAGIVYSGKVGSSLVAGDLATARKASSRVVLFFWITIGLWALFIIGSIASSGNSGNGTTTGAISYMISR
jgi:hypothetical protein